MKLSDARNAYSDFSEKTSEKVRTLGFAGIALIWVFKYTTSGRDVVPPELVPAGAFIVAALALDLFHGIAGTAVWAIYHRIKEKELNARADKEKKFIPEEGNFLAPLFINWLSLVFFWTKVVGILLAYVLIIQFLVKRII